MMAPTWFANAVSALASVVLLFPTAASAQAPYSLTPYNGDRYGPVLTVDKDPICEGVLKDVRAHFLTPKPWQTNPSLNIHFDSLGPLGQDDLVEEPGAPAPNKVIVVDGKKLYVAVRFYNGYGGAADTQGFQVSDQPIPYNADIKSTTIAGAGWSLFKDKDGRFFTAGIEQEKLFHLYRITADKGLELSCTARITPSDAILNADDAWKTAFASTRLLKQARDRIAGGEGSACGSMRTQSRWSRSVDEALAQALYRPWALVNLSETQFRRVEQPGSLSPNSARDYTRILLKLEDWSLGGLAEYRAMSAHRDQLAATVDVVAHFYVVNFQWPPMDIDLGALAVHTLTTAVAQGFGFYLYEPIASESERKLRRAILEHHPLAEIQALYPSMRKDGKGRGEALLDIAVVYPVALRFLLAQGADPNEANGFGKTPLMYAAQYDQEESAAILLDAGADPNAGTVWPQDTCHYALQTANMTPLHYAVRYASAGLIRILLSHGAKTYLKTEKLPYLGKDGEYPVDWFRKYTAPDSKEPNPNIPASEVPALAVQLALPDAARRAAIAEQLTLEAETANAKGETGNVIHLLKEALSVQSDNEHVHSTLLRIALKAEPGFVLKNAEATIAANKSPASVAVALFDQGLACEQAGAGIVHYENRSYCFEPPISLFFRSYQVAPSDAARAKLLSLFNDRGGVKSCTVTIDGVPAKYHVARAYLYVLHPRSFRIDPQSIDYPDSKTGKIGHPGMSLSIDLGDGQSITSMSYREYNGQPVIVGGLPCVN